MIFGAYDMVFIYYLVFLNDLRANDHKVNSLIYGFYIVLESRHVINQTIFKTFGYRRVSLFVFK